MAISECSRDIQPGRRRLVLLGRLQDAEDEHDRMRRARFDGVSNQALDDDRNRWSRIGQTLADVASQLRQGCVLSAFCDARPAVDQITARLSEAIDDQLDPEAWALVDAAARLSAASL